MIPQQSIIEWSAIAPWKANEPGGVPARDTYLKNLEDKINDPEFLGDTTALLRPDEIYDPIKGFDLIKREIIEKM
jgi:hypothetical protein